MLLETQNKSQALLRLKIKGKQQDVYIILGRYTKRLVTEIKMLKVILHVIQNTHIVYG
jgi:hypothetical protein